LGIAFLSSTSTSTYQTSTKMTRSGPLQQAIGISGREQSRSEPVGVSFPHFHSSAVQYLPHIPTPAFFVERVLYLRRCCTAFQHLPKGCHQGNAYHSLWHKALPVSSSQYLEALERLLTLMVRSLRWVANLNVTTKMAGPLPMSCCRLRPIIAH
jgi:hypothetical protein